MNFANNSEWMARAVIWGHARRSEWNERIASDTTQRPEPVASANERATITLSGGPRCIVNRARFKESRRFGAATCYLAREERERAAPIRRMIVRGQRKQGRLNHWQTRLDSNGPREIFSLWERNCLLSAHGGEHLRSQLARKRAGLSSFGNARTGVGQEFLSGDCVTEAAISSGDLAQPSVNTDRRGITLLFRVEITRSCGKNRGICGSHHRVDRVLEKSVLLWNETGMRSSEFLTLSRARGNFENCRRNG